MIPETCTDQSNVQKRKNILPGLHGFFDTPETLC